MGDRNPQPKDMQEAAKKAAQATREILGAPEDKSVYEMCGTDQGTVERLVVALLEWDAARMATETRKLEAEAKLKGKDR